MTCRRRRRHRRRTTPLDAHAWTAAAHGIIRLRGAVAIDVVLPSPLLADGHATRVGRAGDTRARITECWSACDVPEIVYLLIWRSIQRAISELYMLFRDFALSCENSHRMRKFLRHLTRRARPWRSRRPLQVSWGTTPWLYPVFLYVCGVQRYKPRHLMCWYL